MKTMRKIRWWLAQKIAGRRDVWPIELIWHDPSEESYVLDGLKVNVYQNPLIKNTFSIGFQFWWKGRLGRVAVRLHDAANRHDMLRAWQRLTKASRNPEAPESKVAWGDERLSGNEIDETARSGWVAMPRRSSDCVESIVGALGIALYLRWDGSLAVIPIRDTDSSKGLGYTLSAVVWFKKPSDRVRCAVIQCLPHDRMNMEFYCEAARD